MQSSAVCAPFVQVNNVTVYSHKHTDLRESLPLCIMYLYGNVLARQDYFYCVHVSSKPVFGCKWWLIPVTDMNLCPLIRL